MNESVDIMYDKRLFSKEVIRNVNYKEEKNWRDNLLISEKFMSIHQCLKPNSLCYIFKENPNQRLPIKCSSSTWFYENCLKTMFFM